MKSIHTIKIILSAAMLPGLAALVPLCHSQTTTPVPSTLVNVSVLAWSSPAAPANLGFVVSGTTTKDILLRGVGPTLSQFGVNHAMIDPAMTLFEESTPVSLDNDWANNDGAAAVDMSADFALCGAFELAPSSEDAAVMTTINSDSYTLQICGASGDSGEALAEVYDMDGPAAASEIVNFSGCAYVDPANGDLIAGFTLGGDTGATVLVRGIGPSLSQFGYENVLPNPQVVIYDSDGNLVSANQGWDGDSSLEASFEQVGAFGLLAGSGDAALLATLAPGSYTVHVSDVNGAAGMALAEVYLVQ